MSPSGRSPARWTESGEASERGRNRWLRRRGWKLGLRARLFLLSLSLTSIVLLAGGAYLERAFRAELEGRIETELVQTCRTARIAVELLPTTAPPAEVQRLAMRLGASSGARVTVVDANGTVLGDSGVGSERVPQLEWHGGRPEIVAAHGAGLGVVRRHSDTIGMDMLYVAMPFEHESMRGTVRMSLPMQSVEAAVGQVRVATTMAMLLALGFSLLISLVSAQYVTRTVRDLFAVARALVRVEPNHREQSPTGDDLGGLAGSINEMAQAFGETVGTLARERDRFGAVLEGMGEAVVALDGQGAITLCNRSALEILGWKEAPLGKALLEAIREPALHDLATFAEDSPTDPHEVEVATRDGRSLLARAARLSSPEGGVVLVIRDITALRRLENVRRDFVANVSHELRTPVSTIRATAETLLAGALDDPKHAQRFLGALVRNAERLSHIIADLLDLSRIEAGELAIDLQPVSVATAVHRAVEVVEPTARDKNVTLALDVESGSTVVADEKALDQVILNLLDNAVKYTPDGGHVLVRLRRIDDNALRVEVADDGPGVSEQHRGRIFERFYRVDAGRSRELGGTGLGLSIVRHLMEAMRGEVGFEPNTPRGSTFWFQLPDAGRLSTVPDNP